MAGIWETLNRPLVPEEPVRQLQAAIDTPTLERSPWEARLRGFGAGALEGLRGQTSPISLAGLAGLAVPGLGLGRAAQAAPRAIRGLAGAIPEAGPAVSGLGGTLPEFAPIGGEAAINAMRSGAVQRYIDPSEAAYTRILATMGR